MGSTGERRGRIRNPGCLGIAALFFFLSSFSAQRKRSKPAGWKRAAQTLLFLAFLCLLSARMFYQELLLQELCREKCSYCSGTKHLLEADKALFKENMTFQWKSNFACCF